MKKLKLMIIVGTRTEIIRLSAIIKKADQYFDVCLVHTGQNYDYNLYKVFFEELSLREPDYFLDVNGHNLGDTIGNILSASYDLMLITQPDALLVLGHSNSALAAYSAKRLHIPVFHMEAGNRCFDWNASEEINSVIIDHISDVNLASTEHERRYLLAEGIRKDLIFVTGSPLREVYNQYMERIDRSGMLTRYKLIPGEYIAVNAHREENIENDENFHELIEAINKIAERYQMPVVYTVHPRALRRIQDEQIKFHSLVRLVKPLGFFGYNKLQKHAFCVLSDSSTLFEESMMMKFPAVLLRMNTERPATFDAGGVIIGGLKSSDVLQAIEMVKELERNGDAMGTVPEYEAANVSSKVIRIIQSYTKLINRSVWMKRSSMTGTDFIDSFAGKDSENI